MIKIVTHNGSFHTDDVFAVAALEMYLAKQGEEETEVIRTRDKDTIEQANFALDVGGIYDSAAGRFDHHQKGGAGERENGIPYAAFGLVWREYGVEICEDEAIAQALDERLVQAIDGPDNGAFLTEDVVFPGVYPYFLQSAVSVFNPTWKEDDDKADEVFSTLVEWAKVLLEREIAAAKDSLVGEQLVEEAYNAAQDKKLIYLDTYLPWKSVLSQKEEPLLVIFPGRDDRWVLHAVPDEERQYEFSFPDSWRAKRDDDLVAATGVEGAIFCHASLPMIVTESKAAAEALAQKVLK